MKRPTARLALVTGALLALGVTSLPVAAAVDPVIVGAVSMNGGAIATNDLHVVVATPAQNAVSMRLSNDGLLFKEMPWAPSTTWDLGDMAYGTQPAVNKALFVWFDNGTGTWDPEWLGYDVIGYDVTPPVESMLRVSFVPDGSVSKSGVLTHQITWLNTDNLGTQRYEIDQSADGGATWSHVSTTLPLPGLLRPLAAGHTYTFRARGIDYAGNVSEWLVGPAFAVTARQETSSAIDWTGSWKRITASSLWGGAAKSSNDVGAKAKITFKGRALAIVARLGPRRGVLSVTVDGVPDRSITLRAGSLKARRIVWTKYWATSGTHRVTLKLLKVSGGTTAEIDAFVTGK